MLEDLCGRGTLCFIVREHRLHKSVEIGSILGWHLTTLSTKSDSHDIGRSTYSVHYEILFVLIRGWHVLEAAGLCVRRKNGEPAAKCPHFRVKGISTSAVNLLRCRAECFKLLDFEILTSR
jgi:hypothetical protein